ncbi:MAG TPA: anthranilate phosphoribosyltransferase [Polyangia bacterium]
MSAASSAAAPVSLPLREALARVCDRRSLTADEMAAVVGQLMDGEATPAQIGAFLVAMRMKGETVDEIVGAARAMRARMTTVPFSAPVVVDTCGTGGDHSGSANISTLAAFVVAACGVPVAKHGNRALSSRAGAHDALEALGLDPAPEPALAARCLTEERLAFLFAPAYHAATRHVGAARRELGLRTLFNVLGPLTNPGGARYHVNGVFAADRCQPVAEAHRALGASAAMVVHGSGGLDEFCPDAPTFVAELRDGHVRTYEVGPESFGLAPADRAGLRGGSPADNALLAEKTLAGAPGAIRVATVMTAAAALALAGRAPDLSQAARLAERALDDGAAATVLARLRALAPRPAPRSVP